MKKFYFSVFLIAVTIGAVFSQVPSAFNYQAIVRNSSGEIIANQNVKLRISILEDSESGAVVYSETHSLSTNKFGLVTLSVGEGDPVAGTFNSTNWETGKHFIKTEIDPAGGNSFSSLGISELLSVPYALHAQTVANDKVDDADADPSNEIQKLSISGTLLELSNGGGSVTLPSSGGSLWTESGSDIYRSSGSIGIGAPPDGYTFDMQTDDASIRLKSESANAFFILDKHSASDDATIVFRSNDDGKYFMGLRGTDNFTISADLFHLAGVEIDTDGNVNLSDNLTVTGKVTSDSLKTKGIAIINNGPLTTSGDLLFSKGAGDGKVLTSDASGNATWQTPAAGGGSLWTDLGGSSITYGGTVGIGGTPLNTFDVTFANEVVVNFESVMSNARLIINRASNLHNSIIAHFTSDTKSFITGLMNNKDSYWISTSETTLNGVEVEPSGNVNLSDNLTVSGSETLSGDLTVESDAFLQGELELNGGLAVDNNIMVGGEINRISTGTANMLPIAYGTIYADGSIGTSSGNISVSHTETGNYSITITNEPYFYPDYAVTVTLIGSMGFVSASSSSSKLIVSIADTSGTAADKIYSFVVYKP